MMQAIRVKTLTGYATKKPHIATAGVIFAPECHSFE